MTNSAIKRAERAVLDATNPYLHRSTTTDPAMVCISVGDMQEIIALARSAKPAKTRLATEAECKEREKRAYIAGSSACHAALTERQVQAGYTPEQLARIGARSRAALEDFYSDGLGEES